jgi:hypothetical protein
MMEPKRLVRKSLRGLAMSKDMPVISEPMRWSSRWLDSFRYPVNSCDGLPPAARAEAILGAMKQLKKCRRSPSLLVTVESPGRRYINELKHALYGCCQPIAISIGGEELTLSDFCEIPSVFPAKPAALPFPTGVFDESALPSKERVKLQIL